MKNNGFIGADQYSKTGRGHMQNNCGFQLTLILMVLRIAYCRVICIECASYSLVDKLTCQAAGWSADDVVGDLSTHLYIWFAQ